MVALGLAVAALSLQACGVLPIAVLGPILENGAAAVVKTGTEYTTTKDRFVAKLKLEA